MKKSKIIVSLAMALVVVFTLTSCGAPYSGVNIEDYVKVAEYKGLEKEKISVKITDKDVTDEINSRLEAATKTVKATKGIVKDGDVVLIDYVGTIDGEKFDGGSANDHSLTIGSGEFIDGFEDGLIGVTVGKSKSLKLKFPKDYGTKDLAGKDVVFEVKVKSKDVQEKPELDNAFVKENSKKSKTIAAYKDEVKAELEQQKTEEELTAQKTTLWSTVVEKSEMKKDDKDKDKYPTEEVERVEKETLEFYEETAKGSGLELKGFVSQNFGMEMDDFNKQVSEYAKIIVKEEMVLYYIADKESIEISGAEYDKFIETELAKYGYTEDTFKQANNGKTYEEVAGKDAVKQSALKQKVMDFIYDNAKIK